MCRFNRLPIIDLKAKPHYISENNQYILVCNGEIYNYLELKKELEIKYKFYSHVDTEVLLPGYLEWGIILKKLMECSQLLFMTN